MPLKKRPLDRDAGVLRDARLIVIASEDTYAVDGYFKRFRTRRVQVIVIPTQGGKSSPEDVSNRLDEFRNEYQIGADDQLWFCIDKDHWADSGHIPRLAQVLQHCRQAGYLVAISNPCFELWLLLHFEESSFAKDCKCGDIEHRLSELAGGYNKANCERLPITADMVRTAIARARAIDTDPANVIPDTPLTRVHLILDALQERDAIDLE